MATQCGYCSKLIDDDNGATKLAQDQALHLGHWCRGASVGVIGTARMRIDVPRGETRYRIEDDPAYKMPGEG